MVPDYIIKEDLILFWKRYYNFRGKKCLLYQCKLILLYKVHALSLMLLLTF